MEFATKHRIKYVQMIAKHIDPKGTKEETLRKKAILDQRGLVCYTFGVNGTSTNKDENRKLFEFAKLMGIAVIIVEPKNLAEWDNLEELVKEYDIKLAIHNHGTGSMYGDPETVKKVLAARDPRIGVCLDIGWVTAAGFDVAKIFREYNGRVFDMHLKDKRSVPAAAGAMVKDKKGVEKPAGPTVLDVEIGTGQANYKDLFAEIKRKGLADEPSVMFFANYYGGLNEELLGRRARALELLQAAVASRWGRTAEGGPAYMWQAARLHYEALMARRP